MKFKKVVSAALAGAMALSMSATALAADPNVTGTDPVDVEVTGTTQVPDIKVTIPTTASVVVNPYKLAVTVESNEFTDQIVSAPQFIKSESNTALDVTATVTGTAEGSAVFATAPTQGGRAVATNSVFMYLEVLPTEDDSTAPEWAEAYDKTSPSQLLVSTTAATSKTAMVTLAAGDTDASYAAFALRGDAADKPTTAWTAADKVSAAIAFTFTPVIATADDTPTA